MSGLDRGDEFEDIMEEQQGIFGLDGVCGSGLGELSKAKTKFVPDGIIVSAMCGNCCAEIKIGVEYPNLVALKYGVQPKEAFGGVAHPGTGAPIVSPNHMIDWGYEAPHGWFPALPCPSCKHNPRVYFSQHESGKLVESAGRQGLIDPQYVVWLSKLAAARGAQLRGGR
jgi:hypothetical protein